MPRSPNSFASFKQWLRDPHLSALVAILAIQSVAAAYFLFDGVDDFLERASQGIGFEVIMDGVVALALLGGVITGARYIRHVTAELERQERSLASARGALAEHIALRFEQWGLTRGEGEVALFALKGCDVGEIARLRDAAPGTVRSQLSQVYAKAGVSSQAMLVSLFIEDLLDVSHLTEEAG